MKLNLLFKNAKPIEIESLMSDSRLQIKNSLFFCLKGMKHDGHLHINQAVENGAVAIVHSDDLSNYIPFVEYIRVDDAYVALNKVATIFYDYPCDKLRVFGVTGTNGKTTIAKVIKSVYSDYLNCGYIGTIGFEYGNIIEKPDFTTPEVIGLHEVLSRMIKVKMKAVAIEISSQGLEQHRVDALRLKSAIFTNLTHDHLDYHGTMENYYQAKKKIFSLLNNDGYAILNVDDTYGLRLVEELSCKKKTYGVIGEADYKAKNIVFKDDETSFDMIVQDKTYKVSTNLLGMFNVYNLLAVIASCHLNGMRISNILESVKNLPQVDGRLQHVKMGQNYRVIVDYAHTPDGFEKVFEYADIITPKTNKIIAVFGAAGLRDTKKRAVLGSIADRYCTNIIITEEDPRTEDSFEILKQIASGIKTTRHLIILDRLDAIRQAIELANKNDTVLVLGKGNEDYICRANGKELWLGDVVACEEILKSINDEKENHHV
ncbi:MAG: UDP-N-acetylmuramoyl-L-alanyl-D-glutamate--2,6-diaminopimelate ligase [Erysipelotrichaceae bacterium]|nr:UDP-N-acetylmuramoyl-L-alanyl-D-glutamate--2,6-diaminopimelate ligase [Erysipelotrichaceae bacterium]